MSKRQQSLFIYIGIVFVCLWIGGIVLEGIVAGVITLLSFVCLVEAVPIIKWVVAKLSYTFDIAIFIFGIYAKIHFGVTIAMALLFAGLGFTLLYAPYIRETYNKSH